MHLFTRDFAHSTLKTLYNCNHRTCDAALETADRRARRLFPRSRRIWSQETTCLLRMLHSDIELRLRRSASDHFRLLLEGEKIEKVYVYEERKSVKEGG